MLLFLLPLMLASSPVHAIDPGFARGSLRVGSETIQLTHSYAQLHDNAEGVLEHPREMRVLIVDREVDQNVLNGLVFLPVRAMAQEDKVRGLLITLDPNDRSKALVTVLYPPQDLPTTLITRTLMSTGCVMKKLNLSENRITGEIEEKEPHASGFSDLPSITYATTFSAPLFHEPKVTEALKGQAARNSPQLKVLKAAAVALKKADFDTLRKLYTEQANQRTEAILAQGAAGAELAKQAGKEMESSLDKVRRVVVRNNRAVVIFSNKSWNVFERVAGEWKIGE
jgi:hypothetical protein